MDAVLEITRATRTRLITLKRMLLMLVATNIQIFASNVDQLQSLPVTIKEELLKKCRVKVTPQTLPILLALQTATVKIDLTLANDDGTPVWTKESADHAFALIKESSCVVDFSLRLRDNWSEAEGHPSLMDMIVGLLQDMPDLTAFTLHGHDCWISADFLQFLPKNIKRVSLQCNIIVNNTLDTGFRSIMTQNIANLDISTLSFTADTIFLILQNLPYLKEIKHPRTEEGLLLYRREHDIAKPLSITTISFSNTRAIPLLIEILPKLQDITFLCPVVEAHYESLIYVKYLRLSQINAQSDHLIEIWGLNLVKLSVLSRQQLNIALVAQHCLNLEVIDFGDVTDEVDNELRVERGHFFNRVKEICYTPSEMIDVHWVPEMVITWLPILFSSKCLHKIHLDNVDLNLFIFQVFNRTTFEHLTEVKLERCRDQQAILSLICRLPFIRKLILYNCEGQEEIHSFFLNHPHIRTRVAIQRNLDLGEDYLVVNFQYDW